MSNSGHILIVDDDPLKRQATERALIKAGHHVVTAQSGLEALRLAQQLRPNIILLDVVLPDMTGLEVCQRIKSDSMFDMCYVVLFSASRTGSLDKAQGLEEGADGYLTKPISDRELLAHISTYLRMQRAERGLRESEARLRNVIVNNADGMIVVDQAGIIRFANPAAGTLFACSPNELVGVSFGYPIAGQDGVEIDIIGEQNKRSLVEMRVVELMWEGQPAYLASLRDVSERKQAEQQYIELAIEREKVNFLTSFVQGISHEVTTAVTSIYLNLERVKHAPQLDDKLREIMDGAGERLFYIHSIINSMLLLTRLDREPQIIWNEVDVGTVVRNVLIDFDNQFQRKRFTIQLDLPDAPLLVAGNGEHLEIVLHHLIKNAAYFTPDNGHLSLKSYQAGDWAVIEVYDNGVGISEQDLPRLFDHFFRADQSRTDRRAGLGLTIAKKIIEAHQGWIEAESQLGVGSMFRVKLPVYGTSRSPVTR